MKKRAGILLIAILSTLIFSCEKNENDFNLDVTVTIFDTVRVPNVLLFVNVPGIPEDSSAVNIFTYTNEEGTASIGLKAESVVQVAASRPGYKRCQFVKINPGNNSLTLDLLPFDDAENGCD